MDGNTTPEVSELRNTMSENVKLGNTKKKCEEMPTAIIPLPSYTIEYGQPITIECNVTSNPLHTSVTWEKITNGQSSTLNLANTAKYNGGTVSTPSLTILKAVTSDSGRYRCLATNEVGTGRSQDTTLEVTREILISEIQDVHIKQINISKKKEKNTITSKKEEKNTATVLSRKEEKDAILSEDEKKDANLLQNEEIDTILKTICACLNTKNPEMSYILSFNNIDYKSASVGDFEKWYRRIENKTKDVFLVHPTDFISVQGKHDSEIIKITVSLKKCNRIFSFETYLWYPLTCSVYKVKDEKVIDILNRQDQKDPLIQPNRKYNLDESLEQENESTQFKQISGDDIPKTLRDMASHYISAFANYKGGCIHFGIDDNGIVEGIYLTSDLEAKIEHALESRINTMAWWTQTKHPTTDKMEWTRNSLQRGEHWDIKFCSIENLPNDQKQKKIIEVYVSNLPGGTFTHCPISYYLDGGKVKNFEFEDWIRATFSRNRKSLSTKADINRLENKTDVIHKEVMEIKKIVQSNKMEPTGTKFKVTNITKLEPNQSYIDTETSAVLKRHMTNKKCVILKGLVGTGKSELALRYCYSFSQKHTKSFVWMIKCTDLRRMEKTMCHLFCNLRGEDYKEAQFNIETDNILELGTRILKSLDGITNDHILLFDDVKEDTYSKVDTLIHICINSLYVKAVVTTQMAFTERDNLEIVQVQGFSYKEALDFLEPGYQVDKKEKECYKEIARKFSCNPKGLQIARTYMEHIKLSPQAFLERLINPKDVFEMENLKSIQHKYDKTLFGSLTNIIEDIETENKKEVFEMLLLLQFLQVDNIPVEIFSYLPIRDSQISSDMFIDAVQNYCSFGHVIGRNEGQHDKRLLITHDVVVLALEIYMNCNQDNIYSKNTLRRKLLNAFFLLLNKDNIHTASLDEHMLLLPHARYVIEQLNQEDIDWGDFDYVLKMIYLNDLVGYTTSFSKMDKDSCLFYDTAKCLLFRILDVDEKNFDESLRLSCATVQEFSDFNVITNEPADTLKSAARKLLENIHFQDALKKLSKEFVLNRKRNNADMDLLLGESTYNKLTLSEEQYNNLCSKGYAVSFDDLWRFFFYDILTTLLHTFGRRLLYMPERKDKENARLYSTYLIISYRLSLEFYRDEFKERSEPPFSFLSSSLIERSIIQSAMDLNLGFDKGPPELMLWENLEKCKEKILENTNYIEFGTLKMCSGQDEYNKVMWLKQLTRIYKILVRQNKELKTDCIKWGEKLASYISKMNKSVVFPSLILSLGELYFDVEEFSQAQNYFQMLLPNIVSENDTNIELTKHIRKACINYIRCRIVTIGRDKTLHEDTLNKIAAYKKGMQDHKEQLQELQGLEDILRKTIAESKDSKSISDK